MDAGLRDELIGQIRDLIESLKPHAASPASTAEYDLLNRVASELQMALSSVLRLPLDVRQTLGLRLPTADLRPSPRLVSRDEVHRSLRRRADEIARSRKLLDLMRKLQIFTKSPNLIHASIPSTHAEMTQDFYDACVFLAADVISGKIRLADQLETGALDFLGGVWLDDVKRLTAYVAWEQADEPAAPEVGDRFYLRACEMLHRRACNVADKASLTAFDRIGRWLNDKFLTDGRLIVHNHNAAQALVESKAHRIWLCTGRKDPEENWRAAESYSRAFYENIIPGVVEGHPDALTAVVQAVSAEGIAGSTCEIANAFEAALLLEFVNPQIVFPHYDPAHSFI